MVVADLAWRKRQLTGRATSERGPGHRSKDFGAGRGGTRALAPGGIEGKLFRPSMPHHVGSLPPGSELVARWAALKKLRYDSVPEDAWFRAWEPFDTMVSPTAYFNSVSWPLRSASVTHAEPWQADPDSTPIDRTVLTFVSHRGFVARAAARAGEHFNTRVAFIENPPAPTVQLGDPSWDEHFVTRAASASEALKAFPDAVRRLLAGWSFRGHVEVRPGGLIVHWAGYRPEPAHLDHLLPVIPKLLGAYFGARP